MENKLDSMLTVFRVNGEGEVAGGVEAVEAGDGW